MIIIYPHVEPLLPRMMPTKKLIESLPYKVHEIHTTRNDPFSYHNGLKQIWDMPDDVLIIEQDNMPSIRLIEQIRKCPHENCVGVYRLCPSHTKLPDAPFCLAKKIMRDGKIYRWLIDQMHPGKEVFTDCGGFGTCKISKNTRKRIRDEFMSGEFHWNQLDIRTAELVGRYHIHWSEIVRHNCCEDHFNAGGLT